MQKQKQSEKANKEQLNEIKGRKRRKLLQTIFTKSTILCKQKKQIWVTKQLQEIKTNNKDGKKTIQMHKKNKITHID